MDVVNLRQHIIEQVKLHHVINAVSGLRSDDEILSTWEGDDKKGTYFWENGGGDEIAFAWDGTSIVGIAYDHELDEMDESSKTLAARQPLHRLVDLPEGLKTLALKAAALTNDVVTGGLWVTPKQAKVGNLAWSARKDFTQAIARRDANRQQVRALVPFLLSPEDAIFGSVAEQNWQTMASLNKADATLAMQLAGRAGVRQAVVTDDESAALMKPAKGGAAPSAEQVEAVAARFADANIVWKPIVQAEKAAPKARKKDQSPAPTPDSVAKVGKLNADLLLAARNDDPDAIKALLAAGANINAQTVAAMWLYTPAGETPLIQSLRSESWDAMKALLAAGADVAAKNGNGQTALHWAAIKAPAAVVKTLLEAKADPNAADGGKFTPLHNACFRNELGCVEALLVHGADPNAKRHDGKTPLELCDRGNRKVIEAFLQKMPKK